MTDAARLNQGEAHYWDGASVMVWVSPNIINYRTIDGFDPAGHKITYAKTDAPYTNRPERYAIFNSIHLIDRAADYYFQDKPEADGRHKVWLWPVVAGDPNEQAVTVSRRTQGLALGSYNTVQGLTIQNYAGTEHFDGIGILLTEKDPRTGPHADITIRNNTIRRLRHIGTRSYGTGYGAIFVTTAHHVLIDGNNIDDILNSEGMLLGGSDLLVSNNTLMHIGRHGIWYMGGKADHDIIITHNRLGASHGTHGVGISVFGHGGKEGDPQHAVISRNYITDFGEEISFECVDDITLAYNLLVSPGDWYAIHENNTKDNKYPSHNVLVYNNTMVSQGDSLVFASFSPGTVLKNNLMIAAPGNHPAPSLTPGQNGNLWFLHAMMDSLFVDAAKDDLHLKAPPNPAIGAGVDLGYKQDLDGTAIPAGQKPDIGCYQYKKSP